MEWTPLVLEMILLHFNSSDFNEYTITDQQVALLRTKTWLFLKAFFYRKDAKTAIKMCKNQVKFKFFGHQYSYYLI